MTLAIALSPVTNPIHTVLANIPMMNTDTNTIAAIETSADMDNHVSISAASQTGGWHYIYINISMNANLTVSIRMNAKTSF